MMLHLYVIQQTGKSGFFSSNMMTAQIFQSENGRRHFQTDFESPATTQMQRIQGDRIGQIVAHWPMLCSTFCIN
jgi:hypothetical protein